MYMSLYELPDVNKTADHVLPNKKNFTWQSMSFGADTIHVQVKKKIRLDRFSIFARVAVRVVCPRGRRDLCIEHDADSPMRTRTVLYITQPYTRLTAM